MDEPTPPIATVENVFENTTAKIEALKRHKPRTRAEERRCATELIALKREQLAVAEQVIRENAAQKVAEIIGDDHAKPAQHLNGNGNGHAAPANWAQLLAEQEVRFERQIAALKDDLVAKSGGGLGDGEITALAKGLVPFLNERLAEAVAPLQARLAELEARPVLTYEGVWSATKAYGSGAFVTHQGSLWHCEDTNVGVRPGDGSSSWKLAVKRGRADR